MDDNSPKGLIGSNNNETVFKFIMPVLLMMCVQLLIQLFMGQVMFFYKGYTYSSGTYEEFIQGYRDLLASDDFTMAATIISTTILMMIFLFWYRSEIIHAANVSLRNKCRIIGLFNIKIVPGVVLIAVGMGVIALYIAYIIAFIYPESYYISDSRLINSSSTFPYLHIIYIIYLVIIAPICQELVFRGLTLGFAERRMSFRSANIIQALLFATVSMDMVSIIYYFVFGLVLGYIYYRTENIIIPVVCNMLFVLMRLFTRDINITADNLLLFFIIVFAAMGCIYLGIVLVKNSVIKHIKSSDTDNDDIGSIQ